MSDAVPKIYALPVSTSVEAALFLFVEEPSVLFLCHRRDHPPQGGNPGDGTYPSHQVHAAVNLLVCRSKYRLPDGVSINIFD